MHRRIIALILLGGCAWASVTRLNFVVDEKLNRVEVDILPLPETSFDVENNLTFSGFIGFHLENGTVRNLHRRVQRQGDCKMHEAKSGFMPFECRFRIRGLVAKYDVELNVEERLSIWKGVEVHVDGGDLLIEMVANMYSTCTDKCTRITNATVENPSGRLKPLNISTDLPEGVFDQFDNKMVSQTLETVSHALTAAYRLAIENELAYIARHLIFFD